MLYLGFLLGVFGSFHCVGMCSPITLLLPFQRNNQWAKALQIGFYFIGKILTYCILGCIFAFVGRGILLREYQQDFSIFVGVFMFFVGLFQILNWRFSGWQLPIFKGVNALKKTLGKQLRSKNFFSTFFIGFLNGFLPCGLVYTALFSALSSPDITTTILYMACFGLGTSPLMILFIYLGNFLSLTMRKYLQKALPFLVMIVGILFIIRGLGLGIPILSPQTTELMLQENPDCIVPMMPPPNL